MLVIKIVNDAKGTNDKASYDYVVEVNLREIASGHIDGHDRSDGWSVLLKKIAEQNISTSPNG